MRNACAVGIAHVNLRNIIATRSGTTMALGEIGDRGEVYEVSQIPHQREFDRVWLALPAQNRVGMEAEINRRLDELIASPDANWGSITNTSIEGGRRNPRTGIGNDWSGTVFQSIYDHFEDEDLTNMFYGNVWKNVIIGRAEPWIGIRFDPTFPRRGITLNGKTYFLDTTG